MSVIKHIIAALSCRAPDTTFNFAGVSSILIRPMGHLVGDTVAHIVYIRQLKSLYPQAKIGILANDRSRPIYLCCPLLDEILPDTFSACLKNRKKWQLYLDFYETYNSRHIIQTALLAPRCSIIFHKTDKAYYNAQTVRNYDFHCPPDSGSHISSYLQTSVLAKHFTIPAPDMTLHTDIVMQTQGAAFWNSNSRCRILLAPQGSMAERRIPSQELADLLNTIPSEDLGYIEFILCNTNGSSEYLNQLQTLCQPLVQIRLSPPTDLPQYLALVASCDLAVCIDSGTVHLACAFKRPLLALFANLPDNLSKWQPLHSPDIPTLVLTAQMPPGDKTTRHFPMQQASVWLNRNIREHLKK